MNESKKTISFLVCGNGYGHFKRCITIANDLIKHKNIYINFIALEKQFLAFRNWDQLKKVSGSRRFKIIYGGETIRLTNIIERQSVIIDDLDWIDDKIILESDLLISDNYSKILYKRPDTILMGSFLWSEILSNVGFKNQKILQFCEEELLLLEKYKPRMIALKDMAMPLVRNNTNMYGTDWLVSNKVSYERRKEIKNILILGGGTQLINDKIIDLVNELDKKKQYKTFTSYPVFSKVKDYTNNVNLFSFEEDSFCKIDLIICRPGIGSITDAIKYCIPIISVYEEDNIEMMFNTEVIKRMGIGLSLSESKFHLDEIILLIQKNSIYDNFINRLSNISCDGIAQTTNFIISNLRNV